MTKMKKSTSFCGSEATTKYWQEVSKKKLTDEEVELFHGQLHWGILSKEGNISHDMWVKYCDNIDETWFSINPHVEAKTLVDLTDYVNWSEIEHNREIDDAFLLQIFKEIDTANYALVNSSAKCIKEKTWQTIFEANDRKLVECEGDERAEFIEENLVSVEALNRNKKLWRRNEWECISQYHRIDADFVRENWWEIHTKIVKDLNRIHTITDEEFDELTEVISKNLDDYYQKGKIVSLEWAFEKYVLTDWFLEKYSKELKTERSKTESVPDHTPVFYHTGAGKTTTMMKTLFAEVFEKSGGSDD